MSATDDLPRNALTSRRAVLGSDASPEARKQTLVAAGGILAALGAATCCVVPFALFMLGISGAWIGNLTALEPYQPLFAAAAVSAIGYGFYLAYRKPKVACSDGSYCADPRSGLAVRGGLWAAAILVVVALAFPRLAPLFL